MPTPPAPVDLETRLGAILFDHAQLEGPLLPILHAVQAEWGYVPPEALPIIAEGLNISRAEVHGVVSFYHDFREEPAGRHMVKICRAEACQARGGHGVEAAAKQDVGDGGLARASGADEDDPWVGVGGVKEVDVSAGVGTGVAYH